MMLCKTGDQYPSGLHTLGGEGNVSQMIIEVCKYRISATTVIFLSENLFTVLKILSLPVFFRTKVPS